MSADRWFGIVVSDSFQARILRALLQCHGYRVPSGHFLPDDKAVQYELYVFGEKRYVMTNPENSEEISWPRDSEKLYSFLNAY